MLERLTKTFNSCSKIYIHKENIDC